jgi:hypothetical protein
MIIPEAVTCCGAEGRSSAKADAPSITRIHAHQDSGYNMACKHVPIQLLRQNRGVARQIHRETGILKAMLKPMISGRYAGPLSKWLWGLE